MDRRICEIWLSLACTPDSPTFSRLTGSFDGAQEIFNATEKEIRSCVGANASDCSKLLNKDLTRAEEIYKFCTTKGVGLLSYYDNEFPDSLRDIPTPPVLLYYRGKLPEFNKGFYVAIVGTRWLSDYGRINAFRIGYDLAMANATVVSGMAVGIDGVALAGALGAGGKTIAVLGSGIDVCYPNQHQTLAREIVKCGCVFTEYAPGTRPEKFNFPRRNRIISGLCRATIVVEGKESSGSLITARHAKKQGRDVFAFPGNVGNDGSQVTNLLIKNGAYLCTSADDVLRVYENEVGTGLNPHNMQVKRTVNMGKVLSDLKICCVTPSDDIFRVPYHGSAEGTRTGASTVVTAEPRDTITEPIGSTTVVDTTPSTASPPMQNAPTSQSGVTRTPRATTELPKIDAESLKVYKKIPLDVDCAIDSLVGDGLDLPTVMRALLKLEMSRFIVFLPGDRVKRNLS